MSFSRVIVYINGLESVTDSVVAVLLVTDSVFVMAVDKSVPIAISVVSVIEIWSVQSTPVVYS